MKISIKAILIGGIADILLSTLLGIPFSIFVISHIGISGTSSSAAEKVVAATHQNLGLYAIQLIIGVICSVIGGYIAARIAKNRELLNGALASWLCVSIGIYSLASGDVLANVPVHLFLILATPLFYVAGAYLRLRNLHAATE